MKKRVNLENLYIIGVERDGCTIDTINEFCKLPYKNKVIFTRKEMPNIESSICIPNTDNGKELIPITSYKGKYTCKRFIDDFDYVEFLTLV